VVPPPGPHLVRLGSDLCRHLVLVLQCAALPLWQWRVDGRAGALFAVRRWPVQAGIETVGAPGPTGCRPADLRLPGQCVIRLRRTEDAERPPVAARRLRQPPDGAVQLWQLRRVMCHAVSAVRLQPIPLRAAEFSQCVSAGQVIW